MAIPVRCECGQQFRVSEQYAGKRGKCPACSRVLLVPSAAVTARPSPPAAEPAEVEEVQEVPEEPARPRGKRILDAEPADEPVANGIQKSPRKPALPREDAITPGRNGKARRRRPRLGHHGEDGPAGPSQAKTILTGLGMMAAAVIWFVGGLFFGILFYYPPVLFVVGLIAFVKGLMGRE